ncbi:MAG: transglutaminase-like domain-containing protein [archaeon]
MKAILLLLLLIPLALALDDSVLHANTLSMNFTSTGTGSFVTTGQHPELEYLNVKLHHFPKSISGQNVISLIPIPPAQGTDTLAFTFEKPEPFTYQVQALLSTNTYRPQVKERIPFPLQSLDPELTQYLLTTEHLDVSPEMRKQAVTLSQSNDAYEVIGSIAAWIHENVKYNLSTLTADVAQPSSWVFKNKYGVCDEITSLFISMLRSVGIPARYMSGIAYTNYDLFSEPWVNHAWAEVYLPDQGWIPFDIAYSELGYVDATHIILEQSNDAITSAVNFEYQSRDLKLSTGPITNKIDVLDQNGQQQPLLEKRVTPWLGEVIKNSWNVIIINLKNPQPYYVMERIFLANTEELTFSQQSWFVVLGPGKEKKLYAKVHVSSALEDKYTYTFPIVVYDGLNGSAQASFTASQRGQFMTEAIADQYVMQPPDKQPVVCEADHDVLYPQETAIISCPVPFCLENTCTNTTLTYTPTTIGPTTLLLTTEQGSAFLPIRVIPPPTISITDVTYPVSMHYDDKEIIRFTLEPDPASPPENITIKLQGGFIDEQWNYSSIGKETISVAFTGRHLSKKATPFTITVSYLDARQKIYVAQHSIVIKLTDLSFGEQVELWLASFSQSVRNAFKRR